MGRFLVKIMVFLLWVSCIFRFSCFNFSSFSILESFSSRGIRFASGLFFLSENMGQVFNSVELTVHLGKPVDEIEAELDSLVRDNQVIKIEGDQSLAQNQGIRRIFQWRT